MNKLQALVLVSAVFVSGQAMAEMAMTPKWYAGAAYHGLTLDSDGEEADIGAVTLKAGAELNPYFAVEGRYGFGAQDDDVNGINVELDDYYGVYAKGIAPIHQNVSLYGLLGYTHAEATASAMGASGSESEDDVSYGVGADFKVHPNLSVNAEWVSYVKGDNYDLQGFGVGVNFKF